MAHNSFGTLFRMTTWGESHGSAIGVVIDGCPAGIEISEDEINQELAKRAPGKTPYTSPRKEEDRAAIYSGVFEGKTTGAPITLIIKNKDADPSKYEPIKNLVRPGHANSTYLQKYGIFDYRGGGRASARETACRVAAGAVAKKLLTKHGILPKATLIEIGGEKEGINTLEEAIESGDSLGGIVELVIDNVPTGLGEPVYDKIESRLAYAMMSIPATKGFEIGAGFASARMKGSEHNDLPGTNTNHAGGTLGGITNGMPIIVRVAFKPTSSIKIPQKTVTLEGEAATFELPPGSRHDPCVAIRAVPVVEAMGALVIADALLCHQSRK